jgi:hypothetical protein
MFNSVNDSPTLSHEMVLDAIRDSSLTVTNVHTLRKYADECANVQAFTLATELLDLADSRQTIIYTNHI